jgi:hypothetical protein
MKQYGSWISCWTCVCCRQACFFLNGYVAAPQDGDYIMLVIGWLMNVELLVEWELARETEVLEENLSSTTNPTWYMYNSCALIGI